MPADPFAQGLATPTNAALRSQTVRLDLLRIETTVAPACSCPPKDPPTPSPHDLPTPRPVRPHATQHSSSLQLAQMVFDAVPRDAHKLGQITAG